MKALEASAIQEDFEKIKDGILLTPYLRYGSLLADRSVEGFSSFMKKHWHCPKCNKDFMFTLEELVRHQDQCVGRDFKEIQLQQSKPETETRSTGTPYYCKECKDTFMFLPTQILKHKLYHANEKTLQQDTPQKDKMEI